MTKEIHQTSDINAKVYVPQQEPSLLVYININKKTLCLSAPREGGKWSNSVGYELHKYRAFFLCLFEGVFICFFISFQVRYESVGVLLLHRRRRRGVVLVCPTCGAK